MLKKVLEPKIPRQRQNCKGNPTLIVVSLGLKTWKQSDPSEALITTKLYDN
jgi:hypothetical protein